MAVGEYGFGAVVVLSLLVLVAGATGMTPGIPETAIERVAIITPYTAGIAAFFAYYSHKRRRTTPTDDAVFD
jgi:hypothetical protein